MTFTSADPSERMRLELALANERLRQLTTLFEGTVGSVPPLPGGRLRSGAAEPLAAVERPLAMAVQLASMLEASDGLASESVDRLVRALLLRELTSVAGLLRSAAEDLERLLRGEHKRWLGLEATVAKVESLDAAPPGPGKGTAGSRVRPAGHSDPA